MVQSPSWDANWFAASQEIPRISRNPKVHYRIHKCPPPVPILYSSMTAALEGGEWSAARPGRTLPPERPGTHCTGGWVGPRAVLEGRKISSTPRFDPRTVQPVASRYTDWATGPTIRDQY